MRCPKCGYNSFDYLDSCKKCGKDLTEHKQRFGIVSVLFPGQMRPQETAVAAEDDSGLDEAVAVAAAAATATAVAEAAEVQADEGIVAPEPPPNEESSEGADFGFDFMGDSEEEEDLSFDELFEEAPSDEDVEESLPSPEKETDGEFAFDLDEAKADSADESELESDFGFDPTAEEEEDAAGDFSFEPDEINFDDDEDSGAEEDPKDPFDLPESASFEQAPETIDSFFRQPQEDTAEEFDAAEEMAEAEADLFAVETPEVEPFVGTVSDEVLVEPEPAPLPASAGLTSGMASAVEPAVSFADLQSKVLARAEAPGEESASEFEPPAVEPASGAISLAAPAVDDEPEPVAVEEISEPAAANRSADPLLPATGNRVLAFACDLLLLVLVGVSFVVAAEAAISPSGSLLPSTESLIDLSVPYFLVLFSLGFGYFTLFHFLAGQTPGKMLAGLRVETISGDPLLFSQAFLRSVGGLLQLLPIGLGYLAVLFSPERRGWNDQLAGTRLISLRGVLDDA